MPPSVFARGWLVMSLAELGKFAGSDPGTRLEAIKIAKATKHAHTIGWAQLTGSKLHLLKGEWAKALATYSRSGSICRGH